MARPPTPISGKNVNPNHARQRTTLRSQSRATSAPAASSTPSSAAAKPRTSSTAPTSTTPPRNDPTISAASTIDTALPRPPQSSQ
jgi:hypothetical protein